MVLLFRVGASFAYDLDGPNQPAIINPSPKNRENQISNNIPIQLHTRMYTRIGFVFVKLLTSISLFLFNIFFF